MNTTQKPSFGFEERLLAELKQVVADQAGAFPLEDALARRPPWKPRLALAGGVVAAGFVAALVVQAAAGRDDGVPLVVGGDGDAAFVVTSQSNGSVRVEIDHFSDAEGLERKLGEVGIPAQVDYLPMGKTCAEPWYMTDPVGLEAIDIELDVDGHGADGALAFTVDPDVLQGRSLVVMTRGASEGLGEETDVVVGIASGEFSQCRPVDITPGGG